MKKEVDNWLRQAQSDLIAAGNSLKSKNYDWSCFQAQQAAEKALKALYLQTFKEIRKVHDLTCQENRPPLVIACELNTSGMLASLGAVFRP